MCPACQHRYVLTAETSLPDDLELVDDEPASSLGHPGESSSSHKRYAIGGASFAPRPTPTPTRPSASNHSPSTPTRGRGPSMGLRVGAAGGGFVLVLLIV